MRTSAGGTRRSPTGQGAERGRRVDLLLCAALATLTAAVYAPVRHHAFLRYDDPVYVTDNPHVVAGLTREGIVWAFTGVHGATWHPLTSLSHQLDVYLFGLDAGAHLLVNLLLHALNTLLLFGVLRRLTGTRWRSAWVAGLFALHPLHVESVAWVSERKDVLCGLFWMLTLWAYAGYARRPSGGRYALVVAGGTAALLCKPMAVTLPLALLLLDVWPLRRFPRPPHPARVVAWRLVLEKLPLLVLAGAVSVITVVAQRVGDAVVPLAAAGLAERLALALFAYGAYLQKLFWPVNLAVFYPYAPPSAAQIIGAALVIACISAFAWRHRAQRPYLIVGWLWYLGTLVPVIGLVRIGDHLIADRYTYLPAIGIAVMLAWGVPDLVGRWRWGRYACVALAVLALAGCGLRTGVQVRVWRDSLTLFQHAIAVTQGNALAHFTLGAEWLVRGDPDAAAAHFFEALRFNPRYAEAHYNLGFILGERGDREAARFQYLAALEIKPAYPEAHNNLGRILLAGGDLRGAAAHFAEAARLDPDTPAFRDNLAYVHQRLAAAESAQ